MLSSGIFIYGSQIPLLLLLLLLLRLLHLPSTPFFTSFNILLYSTL